jgi:hypothetical protein
MTPLPDNVGERFYARGLSFGPQIMTRFLPVTARPAGPCRPTQIGLHSALRESLDGLLTLMGGQLHRAPEFNATGPRSLAAIISAGAPGGSHAQPSL